MRAPRPVLGDFLRNAPFSVLILLLILAVACSAVPPSISPVTQETLQVPATAPDTIPSDILDNLDPEYGVPPDVLAVTFRSGLTRERKAEILVSVGGQAIIGGALLRVSDGIYIVRVDTGDDMQVLLQARDDLNALAEVVAAGLLTQVSPSGR